MDVLLSRAPGPLQGRALRKSRAKSTGGGAPDVATAAPGLAARVVQGDGKLPTPAGL